MNKKIFSLLIIILIIMLMLSGCTIKKKSIEVNNNPINVDPKDLIKIENCVDLQNMNNNLSGHYILSNDIDCSETKNWNNGAGFIPIGFKENNKIVHFTGSLNGNNFKISDLYINTSKNYVGLFSITEGAQITNLGVENGFVSGKENVGGIVGLTEDTTNNLSRVYSNNLSRVYFNGVVNGTKLVGGIIGDQGETILSESYTSGKVEAELSFVGGLVGYQRGISKIERSFSTMSVKGKDHVGGLVGYQKPVIVLDFTSEIVDSFSLGLISGDNDLGGITGYAGGTTERTFFSGKIIPNKDDTYFGGISSSTLEYNGSRTNYWNAEYLGLNIDDYYEYNGRSNKDLMKQETFKDWDFSNVWAIEENNSYPYIKNLKKPVYDIDNEENLEVIEPKIEKTINYDKQCSQLGVNYAFLQENKDTSYQDLIFNGNKITDNVLEYFLTEDGLVFIKRIGVKNYLYFNGILISDVEEKNFSRGRFVLFSENLIYGYNSDHKPFLFRIGESDNLIEKTRIDIEEKLNKKFDFEGCDLDDGHYLLSFKESSNEKDYPHYLVFDNTFIGSSYNSDISSGNYAFVNENNELICGGNIIGTTDNKYMKISSKTNSSDDPEAEFIVGPEDCLFKQKDSKRVYNRNDIFYNSDLVGEGRDIYLNGSTYGYSFDGDEGILKDNCFSLNGKTILCTKKSNMSLENDYYMSQKHLLTFTNKMLSENYAYFDDKLIGTKPSSTVYYSTDDVVKEIPQVIIGENNIAYEYNTEIFFNDKKIGCRYPGLISISSTWSMNLSPNSNFFEDTNFTNKPSCNNTYVSFIYLTDDKLFYVTVDFNEDGMSWPMVRNENGDLLGELGFFEIEKTDLKDFLRTTKGNLKVSGGQIMFYNKNGELQVGTTIVGKGDSPQISKC